ncbi:hypothetical protein BJ944DRAFT_227493 [Cunninghamella echinulata]|nr:hypothetical protein BJ944DRAFT_227493 [Cunninghamella echinulata]
MTLYTNERSSRKRPESSSYRSHRERSRNSRSASPDRSRSDRRLRRDPHIDVCIATSYSKINSTRFNFTVGISFEPKEYGRLNTTFSFFTLFPPMIYMDLVGCIAIILLLKKRNLDSIDVNIYSKTEALQVCIYGDLSPKYHTEKLLRKFLTKLIDERAGRVIITSIKHAASLLVQKTSKSFGNAKSAAKQNYNKEIFTYLLPREIIDDVGGNELYNSMKRTNVADVEDKAKLTTGDFIKDIGRELSTESSHSQSLSLNITTGVSPNAYVEQGSKNSSTPPPSSMLPPPRLKQQPFGVPINFELAIQLVLTIASITAPPPPPPSLQSAMGVPQPSFLPDQSLVVRPGLSLAPSYTMDQSFLYNQLPPNSRIASLPSPSRSGLLYQQQEQNNNEEKNDKK